VGQTSSTVRLLRRFGSTLLAASPARAAESAVLTIAVSVFEGAGLLLLVPMLQLVGLDARQGSLGSLLSTVRAWFGAIGLPPTLPAVLAIYVAIIALQSVLMRRLTVVNAGLREDVVQLLRRRFYEAVAGSRWVYFSRNRASSFLQVLTAKVDGAAAAAYYLMDLVVSVAISLAYVAMAVRVSAAMTLLVIGCGALLALSVRGRLARARQAGSESYLASTALHAATSDFLESMKIAKAYGAEDRHADEFSRLSRTVGRVGRGAAAAAADTRLWLAVGSAALLAVVVYVAQGLMALPPASLFLLMFLFARLVPRVTSLYDKMQSCVIELPGFEAVDEAEARALAAAEPHVEQHREILLDRSIELVDISFSYDASGIPVILDQVRLSLKARETTAIVGPSGAGKSTIADLLMGLITPTDGVVTIDGVALAPDALRSWRMQIGYVPQETLLFHDTVHANLLWANPGATEEDVWRALASAAADDFVRALPKGLQTVLGDRGVLVSGGERQRLSLARALLRRPRILILDEATSSLDSENERRIQDAIDRLHEQITIVVITHRLSTIRNADRIHVLDHGRIVESGTWRTLLVSPDGRFRALCTAQGIDVDTLSGDLSSRHASAH
jgi:ATP-binding cassette subfamily C protein